VQDLSGEASQVGLAFLFLPMSIERTPISGLEPTHQNELKSIGTLRVFANPLIKWVDYGIIRGRRRMRGWGGRWGEVGEVVGEVGEGGEVGEVAW
jgi:hypothetical protein